MWRCPRASGTPFITPPRAKKKFQRSAQESRPKQNLLVHPRAPPHRQVDPVLPTAAATLGRAAELIDAKASCCSMKDCQPVGHRYTGIKGLEIQIGEVWFVVNPASVLPLSSPDNDAHACYYYGRTRNVDESSKNYLNWYVTGPVIRCVILPGDS